MSVTLFGQANPANPAGTRFAFRICRQVVGTPGACLRDVIVSGR